ncbi:transcription initiation factor IIF subunit alpha-like [Aristolochia californica]|uniref:transcription initiation factor IIF subunit alpha-like n=1 Tax=Aristolochia californica TaxID=171875 RepID=UPI0035D678AF
MSFDLILKPSCGGCGSTSDLYGSNCKHMTLCLSCGKKKAEIHAKCYECGAQITRLIREYNVRINTNTDKAYSIARFPAGLPTFSKKRSAENKWSLRKEGLQGRQVTDTLREKYKNKPWALEDETGQGQYQGHLEGAPSANYYLLMMQGKEFLAIPAGSWYNFNKVAQYKQLTLEEAEEKMKNRRKTADGYERWMMKAANNGAAAFGEVEKIDLSKDGAEKEPRRKGKPDDNEAAASDQGEEDEEEEHARKDRLGLNKKGLDGDEEGPRGGDFDHDDDDVEKGDDWEHVEIFTDDDEGVANDPEEREDFAPEVPAPPEIKQDEEDEEDGNEEEGTKLSKSGKELKKLLGKAAGLSESEAEDDDEDDDVDEEEGLSPVLAPKMKQKDAPKEEPVDNSPVKTSVAGSSRGTPSQSKSAKTKRKANSDDMKSSSGSPAKKVKPQHFQDSKTSSIKEEPSSASKSGAPPKVSSSSSTNGPATSVAPVTEEEIRAVLLQKAPVTTQNLVDKFKARLRSSEDKKAFADILKRISKIQKTNGPSYVVLRDK